MLPHDRYTVGRGEKPSHGPHSRQGYRPGATAETRTSPRGLPLPAPLPRVTGSAGSRAAQVSSLDICSRMLLASPSGMQAGLSAKVTRRVLEPQAERERYSRPKASRRKPCIGLESADCLGVRTSLDRPRRIRIAGRPQMVEVTQRIDNAACSFARQIPAPQSGSERDRSDLSVYSSRQQLMTSRQRTQARYETYILRVLRTCRCEKE